MKVVQVSGARVNVQELKASPSSMQRKLVLSPLPRVENIRQHVRLPLAFRYFSSSSIRPKDQILNNSIGIEGQVENSRIVEPRIAV
jgi:hypothetical protein